jgi:protein-tyrosine phosphatase
MENDIDNLVEEQNNNDQNDQNNDARFILIIDLFCNSLINFALTVTGPIAHASITIKKKYICGKHFDEFVYDIELFNAIIANISHIIKEIIMSINKLFIEKNESDLIVFIESLRKFLLFNINNNIFDNLNRLKKGINSKYKNDSNLVKKLANVNGLIFNIFNITIDIASFFIPDIQAIKKISNVIENNMLDSINIKLEDYKKNSIDVGEVIKNLIDMDLRSQIIISLDMDKMLKCIENKKSDNMIIIIERLQKEYIILLDTSFVLRNEIGVYKLKKKNLLSKILTAIGI